MQPAEMWRCEVSAQQYTNNIPACTRRPVRCADCGSTLSRSFYKTSILRWPKDSARPTAGTHFFRRRSTARDIRPQRLWEDGARSRVSLPSEQGTACPRRVLGSSGQPRKAHREIGTVLRIPRIVGDNADAAVKVWLSDEGFGL